MIAKLITGLGERDLGQLGVDVRSVSRSPVRTSFSFATAPMSPSPNSFTFGVVLALELQQRAHALLRVPAGVDERRVGGDGALEDAEQVDPARERVGERLEDERRRVGALDLHRCALLRRRRHALDDQVEQRVRAEVLRRDAAGDGEHLAARDRDLERGGDVVQVELLAAEVLLHQRLVGLDDLVEQLLAVLLRDLEHVVRDRRSARPPCRRSGSCRRTCGGRRRCPESSCSAPIGRCTATQREENCSWICASVR